ncbi:polymeric immunoglobulin receptor-like isoform X1 [Hemitrygon akajei]|uniref:polymeric immunoglobulin receptor-like isoform X1 n=2 Tax=Hemitrygon akajei TaxID=2704970 RepID=UPI003BF9BB8D
MWSSILLIVFLPGALSAEQYVRGVVGRAITIDCHYEAKYRSHTKYWCRGQTIQCSVLVKTNGRYGRSGRVSITDNPERGIFTVTMENLGSGDTGWYRCGIITLGPDPMFDVYLQVTDGTLWAEQNVRGVVGRAITIDCHYEAKYRSDTKYWYREWTRSILVQTYGRYGRSGRVSITDNLERGRFTVTMENLGSGDTGWYGCGSTATGHNSIFYVHLQVLYVSGALWTEDKVRGVVGRAVTINCLYAPMYHSHTKYLCRIQGHRCTSLVNTNGINKQYGRVTIRDDTTQGIFTVTMKNLVSQDSGLYRCGITTSGNHPVFDIDLQVSDEPPSVPLLRFSPPTSGSSCGDSMSVSCESVHGSLPIQYSWYEKMPSEDSKISDTNKLDLHCQSLKYKNNQYYCKASNVYGTNSSEMVRVSISNTVSTCRNVIEINSTGPIHLCENTVTESMTTAQRKETTSPQTSMIWMVGRWVLYTLLMICTILVSWFTRKTKKPDESAPPRLVYKVK